MLKLYDSFDPVVVRIRYRSGSDRRQLHGHFSGTVFARPKSGSKRRRILPQTR